MKINGFGNIPEILKAYNSQKKQPARDKDNDSAVIGGDILEISVQARDIKEIRDGLKNIEDVREEKVDRLKSEIAAGTYRADARKIAEEIIKERVLDKQA